MRIIVPAAIGVLVAVTLSGCLGGDFAKDLQPLDPPTRSAEEMGRWRFDLSSGQSLPITEGLVDAKTSYLVTAFPGAEPNIGVTSDGSIFISAFDATLRSQDGGKTWEVVYEFDPGAGNAGNQDTADPMLWVDPVTDRVYASHMFPAILCMALAWSDDLGATWETNESTCTLPGLDHQKMMTAVPGPAAPTALVGAHPTVLYQCYQKIIGTDATGEEMFLTPGGLMTWCNMSYDGGSTWLVETPVTIRLPVAQPCGGINGHPAGAPDGTVVIPITLGCPGLYVAVSLDSGLSWTTRAGPTSVGAESIDPEISFTPDGTMYAMWRGSDHLPYLARSVDLGLNWDGPWQLSGPNITSTVFQAMSAGADGRLAVAYLGTKDSSDEPSFAANETRWNLYVGAVTDAGSDAPVIETMQVNPVSDPIQVGCVWLYGGGHPCRNMLDFIDSAVGPDGRFHVAFTKGCVGCTSHENPIAAVSIASLDGFDLWEES